MSKTTSYSAIPYNYSLCLKADCQKASSCLRQLALTHVQNTKDEFQIVNPLKTQDQNGNCQFYRCSELSRLVKVSVTCMIIYRVNKDVYLLIW